MISADYDIRQFIEAVKEKDHGEIIHLADKEAIEAWRSTYGQRSEAFAKSANYQAQLNRLIGCLRSGVQFSKVGDCEEKLLNLICFNKRRLN